MSESGFSGFTGCDGKIVFGKWGFFLSESGFSGFTGCDGKIVFGKWGFWEVGIF
jgi:hypothetical protein